MKCKYSGLILGAALMALVGAPACRAGITIADDVKALPIGGSVDLDGIQVTAVFPDVCYAQPPERVPAIAILGASGLTEGEVIHLRGTKTTFGQMVAVNASPATPDDCGSTALKPLGLTKPLAGSGCPVELGQLVKVWGTVRSTAADTFMLDTGGQARTLVFGDVGAIPNRYSVVSVIGICSEASGPGVPPYGIRVRHASDIVTYVAAPSQSSITIQHAFCRGGQVFLHWSDPNTRYARYRIYRSDSQIDSASLASAELIDSNAPLHSAYDAVATTVALRNGEPDPNRGYRITDLGDPLNPNDCLRVSTVGEQANHFYAVTGVEEDDSEERNVTVGGNSLASPVSENPGSPTPVLDEQGVINQWGWDFPWKTFTWFKRNDEALRDGEATKLTITFPSTNMTGQYVTMLSLHYHGGTNTKIPWYPGVVIAPLDYSPCLPYYGNTWWYGYCNAYPNVLSGTVVNYSETMLLHMLDWAKANCPIDPNRVFVQGSSMGGTGAVSFGLRHPEIFAGVFAVVPQENPGLPGIWWPQTDLDDIWGSVTANLPTNDGAGVWDRMNMTAYVTAHKEDLPFLKVQNSKNDAVLAWFQIPDFYKNLNASRHGFISAWGQGGHNDSSSGLPPQYLSFNIYDKIRLNQSYVAVSNSSANDNPGNGVPTNGDNIGQMNAGYDWQINSDTSQLWSANINYTVGGATTADISARRLQTFSFSTGDHLAYALWDLTTGIALAWGQVTSERDRFFVVERLPFDENWHGLSVWKSSGQTIADVKSMLEGANVDLDAVVVTAVFPGVCYAQALERVPSIAILGASGLTEGSVIHLRGTKTTFSHMPAVNASPAAQSAYGKVALKPLGMAQPFVTPNSLIGLGALVKVWGPVGSSGPDWFTLATGTGSTLIFGNVGAAEDFATAVGIAAETAGPHGESRGIRVRRASDITNF